LAFFGRWVYCDPTGSASLCALNAAQALSAKAFLPFAAALAQTLSMQSPGMHLTGHKLFRLLFLIRMS
jgi:hypothetical protein